MGKPIYFSEHSKLRMLMRGAEENEVITAICSTKWESTMKNRFRCRCQFNFDKPSPINQKFYKYKTVEVIFVEEVDRIEVITVKVYYHNEGGET